MTDSGELTDAEINAMEDEIKLVRRSLISTCTTLEDAELLEVLTIEARRWWEDYKMNKPTL